MESIFKNPKEWKSTIRQALSRDKEEGELTEEELKALVDSTDPPPTIPKEGKEEKAFQLKGEGGSGEKPRPVPPKEVAPASPEVTTPRPPQGWAEEEEFQTPPGKELEDGEEGYEEEGGAPSLHGDDLGEEERDVSIPPASSYSKGGEGEDLSLVDLKNYCEEQFATLSGIVQSLAARLQVLEIRTSVAVPLATPYRPVGKGDSPSPPRHGRTKSGLGVPKAGQGPPTIQKDKIQIFMRANPNYPSLAAIRNSKLKALQAQMGLDPAVLETRVSDWTAEGLYTLLTTAHEG